MFIAKWRDRETKIPFYFVSVWFIQVISWERKALYGKYEASLIQNSEVVTGTAAGAEFNGYAFNKQIPTLLNCNTETLIPIHLLSLMKSKVMLRIDFSLLKSDILQIIDSKFFHWGRWINVTLQKVTRTIVSFAHICQVYKLNSTQSVTIKVIHHWYFGVMYINAADSDRIFINGPVKFVIKKNKVFIWLFWQ